MCRREVGTSDQGRLRRPATVCLEVLQHLPGTQTPPGPVATVQRVTHLKTKTLDRMTTRTP